MKYEYQDPDDEFNPRPKYKLRNMAITRVDLVDRGANQDAHILLAKSDNRGARHPHEYRNTGGTNMPNNDFEGYTREDIADAVEQIGREAFMADPFSYASVEDAIDSVWDDEIYQAYTMAKSAPEPAPITKSLDESVAELRGPMLVRDYLHKAIEQRAELDLLDRHHFEKTMEQRYWEMAEQTEQGRLMWNVMVSPAGQMAMSEVHNLQKSYGSKSTVEEAFNIVRRWSGH